MKTKSIVIIFLGDFNYDARCINMMHSLIKENYSVTFIGTHEKIIETNQFKNINFHRIKLTMGKVFKYLEFYLKTRRYLNNKHFDVAISADLYSLASSCSLKKTKIIYDCREIYTDLAALEYKPLYKRITFHYENNFLKFVNNIITTASSDEILLKGKYAHHSHLMWSQIYNYPMKPNSNLNKINLKNKFNINDNHTLIVYQGVIQKYRGIGQLIKLIKSSSNLTAIIIGDGEAKDIYVNQAEEYNVLDRVKFIGKVPYLHLLDYTAACDIGWLVIKAHGISNQLALPNKLFEYALMGLPVISSSLKNMKNVIDEYNLGFIVNENNTHEQLEAIKNINDRDFINIKKSIETNFTWISQHKNLITIINE